MKNESLLFYIFNINKDTFWWCFLQKYQELPSIQREFFCRVSENYVKLILTEMDLKYRDNFFTMYAGNIIVWLKILGFRKIFKIILLKIYWL
jgi:hypothetical protein